MKFAKNDVFKMVKIAVCLLLITAISTLLVAFVNQITKGPIAEQRKAAENRAMAIVLEAAEYEALDISDKNLGDAILAVSVAKDSAGNKVGYCIKTKSAGYGGDIEIMTGVDVTGVITGVNIINMSETAGVGTKTKEEGWLAQFKGKDAGLSLITSNDVAENEVAAISGATVSSKAVTKGVKDAVNAANILINIDNQEKEAE